GSRCNNGQLRPMIQRPVLWRSSRMRRSAGLACSTMASTRSMRENANAHQKTDKITAMGGISQNGSVSTQPMANIALTQMAFQTLYAVALRPWRVTPAYSRAPTWRTTSGLTNPAAMASHRMPDTGSRMAAAMTGMKYSLMENSPMPTSQASTLLTNCHCDACRLSQSVSGVQNSHTSSNAPSSAMTNGSSTANSILGWHCDTSARLNAWATPAAPAAAARAGVGAAGSGRGGIMWRTCR